eukprot:gene9090-11140_t
MASQGQSLITFVFSTAISVCSVAAFYYYMRNRSDIESRKILEKLVENHPRKKDILKHKFNSYELEILQQLVYTPMRGISFDEIGGLDEIIEDLRDTIFLPLETANMNLDPDLFSIPKGILLYGPPGTGKTMLAKAIASHYGYYFLDINASVLENKWYGETEKLITALFTAAQKIQPVIIFMDEIDSMVSRRKSNEMEVHNSMKSILLQMWDGFKTSSENKILIIGATNRPEFIDEAFQRRLSKKIQIGLPNLLQRIKILEIILKNYVDTGFNYEYIAKNTEHFSGSDLRELSKMASNIALKRSINEKNQNVKVSLDDFKESLKKYTRRINIIS